MPMTPTYRSSPARSPFRSAILRGREAALRQSAQGRNHLASVIEGRNALRPLGPRAQWGTGNLSPFPPHAWGGNGPLQEAER